MEKNLTLDQETLNILTTTYNHYINNILQVNFLRIGKIERKYGLIPEMDQLREDLLKIKEFVNSVQKADDSKLISYTTDSKMLNLKKNKKQ